MKAVPTVEASKLVARQGTDPCTAIAGTTLGCCFDVNPLNPSVAPDQDTNGFGCLSPPLQNCFELCLTMSRYYSFSHNRLHEMDTCMLQ